MSFLFVVSFRKGSVIVESALFFTEYRKKENIKMVIRYAIFKNSPVNDNGQRKFGKHTIDPDSIKIEGKHCLKHFL